jgi:hypothetical protein
LIYGQNLGDGVSPSFSRGKRASLGAAASGSRAKPVISGSAETLHFELLFMTTALPLYAPRHQFVFQLRARRLYFLSSLTLAHLRRFSGPPFVAQVAHGHF